MRPHVLQIFPQSSDDIFHPVEIFVFYILFCHRRRFALASSSLKGNLCEEIMLPKKLIERKPVALFLFYFSILRPVLHIWASSFFRTWIRKILIAFIIKMWVFVLLREVRSFLIAVLWAECAGRWEHWNKWKCANCFDGLYKLSLVISWNDIQAVIVADNWLYLKQS